MPQVRQINDISPEGECCLRLEKFLHGLGPRYDFLPCIITEGIRCLVMMTRMILKNIIMGGKCFLWNQNDHLCLRLCKMSSFWSVTI